jgi:RNA polymerase sigma-70 factor (ECF subfamily)
VTVASMSDGRLSDRRGHHHGLPAALSPSLAPRTSRRGSQRRSGAGPKLMCLSQTVRMSTLIGDAVQQVADIDLLNSAHRGSERAFSELLHPLVELGYRLACGMLHDPQAAEDAVQEASLTAWRKLGRVKDQGKLRPWFLSIVANECRNSRRLKWTSAVKLGVPQLAVRSSEERVLRGVDLRRALSQLNDRDRVVVVLYFYVDLPLEEIAAIIGSSVGAARARLYRSIRRLRPDLEIQEALQ